MKKILCVIFAAVILAAGLCYFLNAKARYAEYSSLTLITESKKLKPNGAFARDGYEIQCAPLGKSRIVRYTADYYNITDSSDYPESAYQKLWLDITPFEAFMLFDVADRAGMDSATEMNTQLTPHKPFDETNFWADMITDSAHRQMKGKSARDIKYINYSMAAVYFMHKYLVLVIMTAIALTASAVVLKNVRDK